MYFLERAESSLAGTNASTVHLGEGEIDTIPNGRSGEEFDPRPVSGASVASGSVRTANGAGGGAGGGWMSFFKHIGQKSNALSGGGVPALPRPRAVPVKVDPKVSNMQVQGTKPLNPDPIVSLCHLNG